MFDCDGVLWRNDHITPIPGINNAIQKLQSLNKRILYVTNNSIVSRDSLQRKFHSHGFESPLENIFGNGYSAAVFIKELLKVSGKVYLVGGAGMKWELDQVGLESVGMGSDSDTPSSDVNDLLKYRLHDDIEAVLVGFDEHFSFNKICKASTYISNPQCHFIATNSIEKGTFIGQADNRRRMPLTGMMVNAISETANRIPVIVGKPNTVMLECIKKKHDIDNSRTVFIGDSLKADMGFAKTVGIDSALVLTGVSSLKDLRDCPDLTPTYVINCFADIVT
jgi:phosphoglycolate phosphatase